MRKNIKDFKRLVENLPEVSMVEIMEKGCKNHLKVLVKYKAGHSARVVLSGTPNCHRADKNKIAFIRRQARSPDPRSSAEYLRVRKQLGAKPIRAKH